MIVFIFFVLFPLGRHRGFGRECPFCREQTFFFMIILMFPIIIRIKRMIFGQLWMKRVYGVSEEGRMRHAHETPKLLNSVDISLPKCYAVFKSTKYLSTMICGVFIAYISSLRILNISDLSPLTPRCWRMEAAAMALAPSSVTEKSISRILK